MVEIRNSASYVRHEPRRQLDAEQVLVSLQNRTGVRPADHTAEIWELLETPQTVHTIARVLADRTQRDAASCRDDVEDVLELLFDADLIEVAPDS